MQGPDATRPAQPTDPAVALSPKTVQGLLDLARELAQLDDIGLVLERITLAIGQVAEFGCSVLNIVNDDGDFEVAAVAGPEGVAEALMGGVLSRQEWDTLLAGAQRMGSAYFDSGEFAQDALSAHWISDDQEWYARTADDPRTWRPEYALVVPMRDAAGEMIGVVSVDMPTTGLIPDAAQLTTLELLVRQAEQAVVAAKALSRYALDEHTFESLFDASRTPMAICEADGRFVTTNQQFTATFDQPVDATAFDERVGQVESDDATIDGLASAVQERFSGPPGQQTFTFSTASSHQADDEVRWYEVTVRGVAFAEASPTRVVCTFADITVERRLRQQYQRDAEHDPLTGLLNRRGLRQEVDRLLDELAPESTLAVLFADLDHFKRTNDWYGHGHGDDVLVAVAESLRAIAPTDALVARLGGDEFIVVMTCASDAEAHLVRDRIAAETLVPDPDGAEAVRVSVGLATDGPGGDRSIDVLIQRADAALYEAKARRGGA